MLPMCPAIPACLSLSYCRRLVLLPFLRCLPRHGYASQEEGELDWRAVLRILLVARVAAWHAFPSAASCACLSAHILGLVLWQLPAH